MEGEAKEDESLEASQGSVLLRESSSRCSKVPSSSKVSSIPERRSRSQLWLHAALMCGRDFLYAVEVVLVAPIMLQLGMSEDTFSYIWFCSPTLGLLLGPIIGSWSDRCGLRWGRRRPFILGFVIGTVIALTLLIFSNDIATQIAMSESSRRTLRLALGCLGTQVMDFCLDQLETPLRAYTLDVCSPLDQQRAFTLQTLFMGFGGALGFIVDGIDWESIFLSETIGFQIKVVYIFAVVIYLSTAAMTLFSIKEVQWKRRQKSGAGKKTSGPQTTKSISDSHVIPAIRISGNESIKRSSSRQCKHGRSVDDRSESSRCSKCFVQVLKNNTSSDYSAASTGPNVLLDVKEDQHESFLQNGTGSKPQNKSETVNNIGYVYPSPTIHSLALFPRISMCKSVFLTMSCPEGLNETPTSMTATTSSLTTDDESSLTDDDDDSAKTDQDDALRSSMPNLSTTQNTAQNFPSTFLEILKNKIYGFSSNPQIPSTGSSVDNEHSKDTHAVTKFLTENEANQIKNNNIFSIDKTNQNSEKSGKKLEKNEDLKNVDVNENLSVVRSLEFEPEDGAKEKLMGSKKGKKRTKRKSKKSAEPEGEQKPVSMRMLWLSIVTMPKQLRYLCLSLLFSMIGIEVIVLWYTNIFGSVVYNGDPTGPANSTELQLYNEGVHMGCWGLTMYAVAMMMFSLMLEKFNLLSRVSLRILYAGGQLVTSISTAIMFLFPTKWVILALSWTIGITVSTSLTIPYILVGKYHQDKEYVVKSPGATKRGFGTDCAILACQMYAGNLLYAAISGPIIMSYGGVKIMILVTSVCHAVAFFFCAFFVTYPGERSFKFRSRKARTQSEDTVL